MPSVRARVRKAQVEATRAVVRWYVENYYLKAGDPGVPSMFFDAGTVGHFAIERARFAAGDAGALFRLLIATTMFQRRQDQQILRILRSMPERTARELTDLRILLRLADRSSCVHLRTTDALRESCDLQKDPDTKLGCCQVAPSTPCHLKVHTVVLRRYGHFGKVPTSVALAVRESGAGDLGALHEAVLRTYEEPTARAAALEAALCRAWRVNQKIASMFLSAVTNPDLSPRTPPWGTGIDWRRFVVVDSNVDLFLASIGYRGGSSYDARSAFVRDISRRIDLASIDSRLSSDNPRIVQQAMYLFMSVANRRAALSDCMHAGAGACRQCDSKLRARCPVGTPYSQVGAAAD